MMHFKKPSVLYTSLTALHSLQCCPNQPPSSCRQKPLSFNNHQYRAYAQVADDYSTKSDEPHRPWPQPEAPHKILTPYQVLGLKKHETYSKEAFHRLVKAYHPDRTQNDLLCPNHIRDVPQNVRLERYRLIVAAHTLLSDPVRRNAYDRHGAGWTGNSAYDTHKIYESRDWKPGENPMQNATWEDWERWYNRDSKNTQSPLYLSNTAFLSIVILVATVGAFAEAHRAKIWGLDIMTRREMVHADAVRELRRAKEAALAARDHDSRVRAFLERRDGTALDEEVYRKLLPQHETCSNAKLVTPES